MALISRDRQSFVESLVDLDAKGAMIPMPDGSHVPRLPGYRKWIWDGEFCGSIGFRWQVGTEALPAYCLGHIGYSVVPWKQRQGYATKALQALLPDAKAMRMKYVEITTSHTNEASRKVILASGGVFVEQFTESEQHGFALANRYRIFL